MDTEMTLQEADERQKAKRRMTAYKEMADMQIQTILESMMTLKKVDSSRASSIITNDNSVKTDALLQIIFRETLDQHQVKEDPYDANSVLISKQDSLRQSRNIAK